MAAETWPAKLATIRSALERSPQRAPRRGQARRPRVMVTLCGGGFASYTRNVLLGVPPQAELLIVAPHEIADWLESDLANARAYRKDLSYRLCPVAEQRSRNHGGPIETLARLARGLADCWRAVRRERPQAVVGVAASLSIPLLLSAKLAGARTVFVESLTRVSRVSRTGRIIAAVGLADRVYVQWPQAARRVRRGRYEGRLA
jgi:hypothetical protein